MQKNDLNSILLKNFNFSFIQKKLLNIFETLLNDYFRAEFINENYIQKNKSGVPVIYVLNHSGMSFPWDMIMFQVKIISILYSKNKIKNLLNRPLLSPYLEKNPSAHLFFIPDFYRKTGCVSATGDNFDYLMKNKETISVNPEGILGIGKGFDKKYQLQKYHKTFMRMIIKYKPKVIPVTIINGEYLNPLHYSFNFINNFTRAFLKIPFIPVGFITPFIIFPSIFFMALPAKLTFVFHPEYKIKLTNKITKNNSEEEITKQTEIFKKYHQRLLSKSVKKYHKPYEMKSWFQHFLKTKNKKMMVPFFWMNEVLKTLRYPLYKRILLQIPVLGFLFCFLFYKK